MSEKKELSNSELIKCHSTGVFMMSKLTSCLTVMSCFSEIEFSSKKSGEISEYADRFWEEAYNAVKALNNANAIVTHYTYSADAMLLDRMDNKHLSDADREWLDKNRLALARLDAKLEELYGKENEEYKITD